jgi:hypothetical protein
MMIGLNFLDIFAQISRLDHRLNNYRYQSICLPPLKIDLPKYLGVILSLRRPYMYFVCYFLGVENKMQIPIPVVLVLVPRSKQQLRRKINNGNFFRSVTVENMKTDHFTDHFIIFSAGKCLEDCYQLIYDTLSSI